jgi:hypothetical protein
MENLIQARQIQPCCQSLQISSLRGLASVTATCVFFELRLQLRTLVRDIPAHMPSPRVLREEFSLKIPARNHCKNLQHRGRSTCFMLHAAHNKGHHGRTRLSQPLMNLCAPNLQDTVLKPLQRDGEAV